jgi:hypothetical protein
METKVARYFVYSKPATPLPRSSSRRHLWKVFGKFLELAAAKIPRTKHTFQSMDDTARRCHWVAMRSRFLKPISDAILGKERYPNATDYEQS